ncbi:hypothetical protein D3C78_695450 [compost metagenome]
MAVSNANLGGGLKHGTASLLYVSSTRFECKFVKDDGSAWVGAQKYYANRYGDTCPSGSTYDAATGSCIPDNPCADKVGDTSLFSKSGSIGDGFFFMTSGGVSGTANYGCQGGCQGNVSGAKCRVFAGEPGTYTCAGDITFTGEQCTTATPGDVSSSDSPTPPDAPPTEETDSNCGSWISSGDGQSQTCVTTTTKTNPGTADAGAPPSPDPSNSTDDTTTVTDKITNPDGTTTTTTTKTSTNTYCTVGACTTTTTTNTTTSTVDAGGNVSGSSSTCTGPNCGKPTDGTGTGSGGGTGGEGDSEITVTGSYSGNLASGEQGNFDAANVYWDEKIADSKQQLRTKLDDMKAAVTATTSPTLSGGAGGLPCGEPITFGDGYSIDLCFSPYEGSLEGFKAFILFLAAVVAFYIVFVRS